MRSEKAAQKSGGNKEYNGPKLASINGESPIHHQPSLQNCALFRRMSKELGTLNGQMLTCMPKNTFRRCPGSTWSPPRVLEQAVVHFCWARCDGRSPPSPILPTAQARSARHMRWAVYTRRVVVRLEWRYRGRDTLCVGAPPWSTVSD
jgi:hypothetical protein